VPTHSISSAFTKSVTIFRSFSQKQERFFVSSGEFTVLRGYAYVNFK